MIRSLLICLSFLALMAKDPLTLEDITKLQSVTDVCIAPSGQWAAYTVSVPRNLFVDEDGPAYNHLYVWDAKRGSRAFVTGSHSVSRIQVTGDSKNITFLSKRDNDEFAALYALPVDGGEAQRWIKHETSIGNYDLSPDGKRVAFTALTKGKDRKKLAEKGFKAELYEEETPMGQLFVWDHDTKSAEPMNIDGSVDRVVWSPNSQQMAITVAPTGLIDDNYMFRQLQVIDQAGAVVQKFKNAGKSGSFVWAPDGQTIAIIAGQDIHDPKESTLTLASMSDGRLRTLLSDYQGHAHQLHWKKADKILALYDVGTQSTLLSINVVDAKASVLIPPTGPYFSNFEVAGDQVFLEGESSKHPGELFGWKLTSKEKPKRLTNSNEFLDQAAIGKQEVVQVKARDGVMFEGILIRPVDEQPNTRYPLIMCVHGGPESHISNGWLTRYSYPGHLAAAQGYAVFYPNYRGSTGRGVAFSKLSQGDPAGKEFDDLVDAVDHLVAMGLVDRDKVGITGGSYGGYATAWASTKFSDRFAAGVMFVGISDKLSKVGTTDIANEEFYVHAMHRIWDNDDTWRFFLERSPIFHAGNSKTPLLIMHGKEDPRVHPSQSMEMFRHLKLRGEAPVRLVFYPGEGHGNRKGAARYDYSLRLMRWMDHYLKGAGGAMPEFDLEYPAKDSSDSSTKVDTEVEVEEAF